MIGVLVSPALNLCLVFSFSIFAHTARLDHTQTTEHYCADIAFFERKEKTTAVKANCFEKLFKTFFFLRSRHKIFLCITCTCAQRNIWRNNILGSVISAPERKQCPCLTICCAPCHENWQLKTIEALKCLILTPDRAKYWPRTDRQMQLLIKSLICDR